MGKILLLFKSEDSFIKKNYRPIIVLPTVSKVYERIIQDRIVPFMEPVMSICLIGFRKGYKFEEKQDLENQLRQFVRMKMT